MMNLMHWRLMVAVADAENVTRAAERYGISQSGASQAISQMEEALGIKLFVRDRRTTTVTAIGEQVIARARRMLSEFESIQGLVGDCKDSHVGKVRLASFPSVFTCMLSPVLQALRRMRPGIEVVSLEGTDQEVLAWLKSGAVDVGIVLNPLPEHQALMLGADRWVVVAPTAHRLARAATEVTLQSIVDEPFILATGGCHLHGQTLAAQAGLQLSHVVMTVKDWATAYTLVGEGMGLCIVPESTLPEDKKGMHVLHLAQPIYRRFGLVCSSVAESSGPVRALLDMFSSSLSLSLPLVSAGQHDLGLENSA
jgi:DNA-binding transcriptional LysR family regulator